jgi:hypothetical protein
MNYIETHHHHVECSEEIWISSITPILMVIFFLFGIFFFSKISSRQWDVKLSKKINVDLQLNNSKINCKQQFLFNEEKSFFTG